jgi:hypothetical protein
MTENRRMRLIVHSVIFFIFCAGGVPFQVFAQSESPTLLGENAALEFSVKKEQNESKVADFYTRLILLERYSARREQGAEEMRNLRKRWAAEEIKARQEFKREKKLDSEAGLAAHEKAMAERAKEHELARKDYVRRRDELDRRLKSAGSIPEDIEYRIGYENN